MVRDSFDEEVASAESAARKAEMQRLSGPSFLLFCWEQTEAKNEPDLLQAFESQFGLQYWPTAEGALPKNLDKHSRL